MFCFISIAGLTASRILCLWLLGSLSFNLDSEDLLRWYKHKSWSLWATVAVHAAGIHSQNSLLAAETPSLQIFSYGTYLKWSERPSQSARELSGAMRWKVESTSEFEGKSMGTETITWSEFINGVKTIEQILAPEEKRIESTTVRVTARNPNRKLTIWAESFEITRSISSSRIG